MWCVWCARTVCVSFMKWNVVMLFFHRFLCFYLWLCCVCVFLLHFAVVFCVPYLLRFWVLDIIFFSLVGRLFELPYIHSDRHLSTGFFFLVFHSFRFIVCFSSRHSLHDYCHITFDAILFMIVVDRVDICCCLLLYICLIKVIESLEIWTNNFNHLQYNWLAYYISKAPHYWYLRSWNWIQIERFNSLGNLWPKKLPFFYWHSSSSSTTQPRKCIDSHCKSAPNNKNFYCCYLFHVEFY